MKKILFILFSAVLHLNISAQADSVKADTNTIFRIAEQMPEFPGGETALMTYLQKNLKYPNLAKDSGIEGKVWVSFIIDKEGAVKDVKVLKSIGGGCDEEAIRVIKMMPRWKPGIQDGKPVSVQFRIPVIFTLK